MKKITIMAALAALILCTAAAAQMAEDMLGAEVRVLEDYSIVVDGVIIEPDVPPVEKGGVVFIPLRFAAEVLRAEINWNKNEKTAELVFSGNRRVRMKIGDPTIDMGETQKILPVAPFIFESRTMIPLRPVAECGWYKVEEKEDATILTTDQEIKGYAEKVEKTGEPGKREGGPLDKIREKAGKDETTRKLKPIVIVAWIIIGLLWVLKTALRVRTAAADGWKDIIIIGLFLSVGMYIVILSGIFMSTYWAAIVILVTSAIGLVSTEEYTEKLVTMASTAQGAGLICTLFGLGLLIGPAIALRDIEAIGFGIYVKIEPTITGLALSILMNMLFGYEARKQRD